MSELTMDKVRVKPFLKWAGGKSQMLGVLEAYMPKEYNNYIEPFLGGGAMFFFTRPLNSILADSNEELINTYTILRDSPYDLINAIKELKNDEETFYHIRSQDPLKLNEIQRAARFIFLNKTCFNGLYRVNKKGQFNVPYGHRKSPTIIDDNVIHLASNTLQNSKLINSDYSLVLKQYAEENDFIFLDPPYDPLNKNSDFKRYTKEFFYKEDQIRLKHDFDTLVNKGCKVLLTNSNTDFIINLYSEYHIEICETKRMINSDASKRTGQDIIVRGGF